MLCPNCETLMDLVNVDNQVVLHCANCGSSFFEENGINRISVTSAIRLAADKKNQVVLGLRKTCPKDNTPLLALENNEAIPPNTTLLRCSTCHGIFTYPDDLLNFKKAQKVKVDFFKIWQIPPASLKAILVLTLTAIFLVSLFSTYNSFLNRASRQIEAEDLIKKIDISKSGRFLIITFSTNGDFRSDIIFKNGLTGKIIQKTVSSDFKKIHFLVTDEINLEESYTYQIILYDPRGIETKVEEKFLEIK